MALNFSSISVHSKPHLFGVPKQKHLFKFCHLLSSWFPSSAISAVSEGTEGGVTEEDPLTYSGSSALSQLDLLEQLTTGSSSVNGYESDGSSRRLTIREQLVMLVGERDDDFSIPLGKNLKKFSPKFLTIPQKRNIRRQAYLDEVSQRNDSVFFATIGAFVILPHFIILGIATANGLCAAFSLICNAYVIIESNGLYAKSYILQSSGYPRAYLLLSGLLRSHFRTVLYKSIRLIACCWTGILLEKLHSEQLLKSISPFKD